MFETETVRPCLVQVGMSRLTLPVAAPLIYFLLTNGKGEQMNFLSELFIRASCSRLRSLLHHIVGDVKLGVQEKLFVLMKLSGF